MFVFANRNVANKREPDTLLQPHRHHKLSTNDVSLCYSPTSLAL